MRKYGLLSSSFCLQYEIRSKPIQENLTYSILIFPGMQVTSITVFLWIYLKVPTLGLTLHPLLPRPPDCLARDHLFSASQPPVNLTGKLIYKPRTTYLQVESVAGDVSLQAISGPIAIGPVSGDLTMKGLGPISKPPTAAPGCVPYTLHGICHVVGKLFLLAFNICLLIQHYRNLVSFHGTLAMHTINCVT
jgi:hypothetical protein